MTSVDHEGNELEESIEFYGRLIEVNKFDASRNGQHDTHDTVVFDASSPASPRYAYGDVSRGIRQHA